MSETIGDVARISAAVARAEAAEAALRTLEAAVWGFEGPPVPASDIVACAEAHRTDSEKVDEIEAEKEVLRAEKDRAESALRDLRAQVNRYVCFKDDVESLVDNIDTVDELKAAIRKLL